jgi:hypothetical protein
MVAMTIPERFAVAMMERLIPPLSMVIAIAMVRIPSSGSWKAIELKFDSVKNFPGTIKENIINVKRNKPPKSEKFGYLLYSLEI